MLNIDAPRGIHPRFAKYISCDNLLPAIPKFINFESVFFILDAWLIIDEKIPNWMHSEALNILLFTYDKSM